MGRAPCCDKANVKRGPWSTEEDSKLKDYIEKYGTGGNWIALPQKAGLKRCGKSCRLRWLNYLRPNIKHGDFTDEEDRIICSLFSSIGSRWSIIAAQLPGRTDNDIKNYWNTKLKKKFMAMTMTCQSQRKPPPFPSSHHNPSFPLSSLYKESPTYYPPTGSFTAFEPISTVQPLLLNNDNATLASNCSFVHTPEGLVSYMQQYYPAKENFIMFGSGEPSCSSSDGSSSHISYGREIKQEDMSNIQGFGASIGYGDDLKFMLCHGTNTGGEDVNQWIEKPSGYNFDKDLEDLKRLISSSSNNNCCNDSLIDENKTQEKVMYYYY